MRIILSLILSVAIVVSGKPTDLDRQAYLALCRYHNRTSYVELLPVLKRRFLSYAKVNSHRQHWEPIQSDYHLVEMVRHNACPSSFSHKQAAQWLRRQSDLLFETRNGKTNVK